MGEIEEPDAEIAFQDDGPEKWRKVNPEYEHLRKDSDGDGLSDQWEGYNNRDANDGKLLFTFDCADGRLKDGKLIRDFPISPGSKDFSTFIFRQEGIDCSQRSRC